MILAQTKASPSSPAGVLPDNWQFRWGLLEGLEDNSLLLAGLSAALLAVVTTSLWLYYRERQALSRPVLIGVMALRLLAIAGIVVMLLGPQWRQAEQVVRPSQVVVLVDDSVSMAMPNTLKTTASSPATRAAEAERLLFQQGLLEKLAKTHRVSVAATSAVNKAQSVENQAAQPMSLSTPASEMSSTAEGKAVEAGFDRESLRPKAQETRLGDALQLALEEFSGEPLAGIVLLTDGRQNGGRLPQEVAPVAAKRGAPVLTIGFGPERAGDNLAIRDLVAPSKAYPADEIELTVVIDTTGDPKSGSVLSLYRRGENDAAESAVLLESQALEFQAIEAPPADSQPFPNEVGQRSQTIVFTTKPEEVGRFVYSVRASELPGESRVDDNQREATVEVVDRVTRVLLWAGGPNRDYRFLRNQLQRDDSFVVDVRLQSAPATATQDAHEVLPAFPETAAALDQYDVVVAFDPDWSELDEREVEILRDWVSRGGGGLFYAPGTVNTPKWRQRDPNSKILALFPVELPDRLALLTPLQSPTAAARPRPIRFTRAGVDAPFLWIAGSPEASRAAWRQFPGFYQVGQTTTVRPGATVYAEVGGAGGDEGGEEDRLRGTANVLFAEQFFGAGRVFYSGTSELWRLRKGNPSPFSTITTKLLRQLAQGRLLSNSPGGSLLFERDRYDLGDTMVLRALRPNAVGEPDEAVATNLRVQVISPSGGATTVELEPTASQREAGVARLPADAEGVYEAVLSWDAGSADSPRPLTATTRVVAPAAERVHPTRDAALLARIAKAGGGYYYPTAQAALDGMEVSPPVVDALPSREETRIVYGQPDPVRGRRLADILLGVICGALILEWLTRRLSRLA